MSSVIICDHCKKRIVTDKKNRVYPVKIYKNGDEYGSRPDQYDLCLDCCDKLLNDFFYTSLEECEDSE